MFEFPWERVYDRTFWGLANRSWCVEVLTLRNRLPGRYFCVLSERHMIFKENYNKV